MSATPERKEFAKKRIRKLNNRLANLYVTQPKTPEVYKSIKSCQQAVRRWEKIIEGRI